METPVRSDYENSLDLSLILFPISREGQNFNLLNIHYLNLNQLQALEPVKHEKLQQWISLHLGLFFSESDNEIIAGNKLYTQQNPGSFANLKESITTVFTSWAGLVKK